MLGLAGPCVAAGSAAGDPVGVTLRAQPAALLGKFVRFSGNVGPGPAQRRVVIERLAAPGGWVATARAAADSAGNFVARWRANQLGRLSVKAVLDGGASGNARAAANSDAVQMTVYRPVVATYFGSGFYGQRTACGEMMTPSLLGVAHRSLPCGTPVEIYYRGQVMTVPVVDRGPYARGVTWDLTAGTAQALGITSTVRLGSLAWPGQTLAAPSPTPSVAGGTVAAPDGPSTTTTPAGASRSGGAGAAAAASR